MNKEHCTVGKYSSGHVSTANYSYERYDGILHSSQYYTH